MANLPVIGGTALGGLKITAGYHESEARLTNGTALRGGTVAVTMPVGPLSVGYQKKGYQAKADAITEVSRVFYKDDVLGVAYAVNDDFAISYNLYESVKHIHTTGNVEQETKAINIAYTVGGLTLGFQDAKTSNAAYTLNTDDDTRTISIKTAF